MTKLLKIGILAYHGDISEHEKATQKALKNLQLVGNIITVRTKEDVKNLDALIIAGGESNVLYKLAVRAGIFEDIKNIKNIFGTCAGAIMLANTIHNKTKDQETLGLMDIEIDRNAYGRQTDSFEQDIETSLGKIPAVFIRAPKIISAGKNVTVLAKNGEEILACEEHVDEKYYLATTFHPELTTTKYHEHFLKNLSK